MRAVYKIVITAIFTFFIQPWNAWAISRVSGTQTGRTTRLLSKCADFLRSQLKTDQTRNITDRKKSGIRLLSHLDMQNMNDEDYHALVGEPFFYEDPAIRSVSAPRGPIELLSLEQFDKNRRDLILKLLSRSEAGLEAGIWLVRLKDGRVIPTPIFVGGQDEIEVFTQLREKFLEIADASSLIVSLEFYHTHPSRRRFSAFLSLSDIVAAQKIHRLFGHLFEVHCYAIHNDDGYILLGHYGIDKADSKRRAS